MAVAGRFQDEWKLLHRGLRRRSMLRGALIGGALGALAAATLVITFVSSSAVQAWFDALARSWFGSDDSDGGWAGRVWPIGFLTLPLLAAGIGAVIASFARRRAGDAAAWADVHGGGADSVRTAISGATAFRDEIETRAATVMSHARTASVRIRGSGFLGSVVILLSVVAVGVAAWFESKRPSDEQAADTASDVASALMRPFAGLLGFGGETDLGQLADWAKGLDLSELGEGAVDVARLEEVLGQGGLTQGQALSELNRIRSRLDADTGGDASIEAIQSLLDRPELLALAKQFLGPDTPERAAESASEAVAQADPETVERLRDAVSRLGDGRGGEPGLGSGTDGLTQSLVKGVTRLIAESPLAKRLLGGRIDSERASGALRAREALRGRTEELQEMVLEGGRGDGGSDSSRTSDSARRFEVLLKDLPPVPRRERTGEGRQNGAETGETGVSVLVPTTGRELEASAGDYRSRGHRIPRDLRDAAARYFGGERGGR